MFNPAINETTNYVEFDSLLFLYCSPSHHASKPIKKDVVFVIKISFLDT